MLGHPSVPQHDLDQHSQENRLHTAPGYEGRGHIEQPNASNKTSPREPRNSIPDERTPAEQPHSRAPASPDRREAAGVPGSPPRPAGPPQGSPNVPELRRKESPAPRPENPGAQRAPQEQQRPPQLHPAARPPAPQQPSARPPQQPTARPQPPQQPSARPPQQPMARPQPPQQPNKSRPDAPPRP